MGADPGRSDDPSRPLDAIVVGAGMAGLRVARRLVDGGRTVRVLEARPQVGGRLRSVPSNHRGPDHRLDVGATWFWPNEPRVNALVKELRVPVHRQYRAGDALYEDPRGIQRLQGNPLDVESGRFTSGAASLAEALAGTLPAGTVETGVRVEDVSVTDDSVRVRARRASGEVDWHARHLVLALPPSLAAAGIAFDPALPQDVEQLATATPVWMGSTAKVVVEYAEPFWRERGLAGAAISHVGPLREIHDMSGPDGEPAALFGFAAPPGTRGVPGGDLDRETALAQLVRLFGRRAAEPLAVHIVDWSREPGMSAAPASTNPRYDLYGHPLLRQIIHGRIHLASTETGPAFGGHIEGALMAADEVADALLASAPTGATSGG